MRYLVSQFGVTKVQLSFDNKLTTKSVEDRILRLFVGSTHGSKIGC